MIVAIHQPNFLPWLGYFHKIRKVDHFVFLDHVPFSKGSYTNRVRIRTTQGTEWLTVPVLTKGRLGQPINQVLCNDSRNWRTRVVKTIQTNYSRCPFYDQYHTILEQAIENAGDSLADLNITLIVHLLEMLGIRTLLSCSSKLEVSGESTDRLVAICKCLGATTYVFGAGGVNYQEEKKFHEAGIRLEYAAFDHPVYPQPFGDFMPGLSVIDALFNRGGVAA